MEKIEDGDADFFHLLNFLASSKPPNIFFGPAEIGSRPVEAKSFFSPAETADAQ